MQSRSQVNRRISHALQANRQERLKSPQIVQRGKAVRRSGGTTRDRRAFVKTPPSSGNNLVVYLDSYDPPGEEVTVVCDIYDDAGTGGTFADDVRPNFTEGCALWVCRNGQTWRNKTTIFTVAGLINLYECAT